MANELTRRNFLKSIGAAVLSVSFLEVLTDEPSNFSFIDIYDPTINSVLSYFRELHEITPDRNLIKAMIAVESGSIADREKAFRHDPMQIANEGDYALNVLASGDEHTEMVGDFSFLQGIKYTPRINGRWDYSQTNMTPEASIRGGVGWLYHKAAIRNYVSNKLQITGWRTWSEAVRRYNGGGDPAYVHKVFEIKGKLD